MKHTDNQHRHLPLRTMALVGATSLALAAAYVRMSPAEEAAPMSGPVAADLAPGTSSFADVIERVSPAVVNIAVTQLARTTSGRPGPQGWRGGPPVEEFFGRFFQFEAPNMPAPQPRREGLGSGFLIDAGGYVVTNNHVIDGADEIVVTLNDGRQYDATLAGHDPKTDLALLKIAADEPLPYVRFADSDHSRVGDWVLAIGNPFGLGGTATAGIISARGRDIQSGPYDDYLQIDAPINSGNSGGPVFNARGEVIGINTAIFSPNGGNIGIGFAIPANQARLVVDQLRESGAVERGWLGVEIQDLDTDLAASLGLESPQGALIANVSSDGPARKAGFEPGDVVTRFGADEIESARDLSRAVGAARPGQKVDVAIWRDGRDRTLKVTLGEAEQRAAGAGPNSPAAPSNAMSDLGWELRPLDDTVRARLGVPDSVSGVVVGRIVPGGPAAEKGLRPGDIVTRIGRKPVATIEQAEAALHEATAEAPVLVVVRRGDSQRFVSLGRS